MGCGEYTTRGGEYTTRGGEYTMRGGEYTTRGGEYTTKGGEYTAGIHAAGSVLVRASTDFLFKNQLFCVRSSTRYPLATSCMVVRFM